MIDPKPRIPGRGMWTRRGGLLPARPGVAGALGYYRANVPGEPMIGLAGTNSMRCTRDELAVHHGVRAIQRTLGNLVVDGLLGSQTGKAIYALQRDHRVLVGPANGVLGPRTAIALWRPLVREVARAQGVPPWALGGLARHESGMDPAAISVVNGVDTGLCQINLSIHKFTVEQVCDPTFALEWSAKNLREAYSRWEVHSLVDPWSIAIANHNSPVLATQWANTGNEPFSIRRAKNKFPQIGEYVMSVRKGGAIFA